MDIENNPQIQQFDSETLRKWFFLNRRILPWRDNPSPYEVWVSEVMLQQTQVTVVIPYFQRWMTLFPTIQALAESPLEKVIKVWEGLGYYSRARNLHQGARHLLEMYGGELPDSYEKLKTVKGLGPYTIGAILGFAFKQKAPAVDGNVLRVLARYFCIEESVDSSKARRTIEHLTASILPDLEPWVVMEALIELGALVCQKKPKCEQCPLNQTCLARNSCKAELLPVKGKKPKTEHLHRSVAVIHSRDAVLLKQGESGKLMADLWEFPYFDLESNIADTLELTLDLVQELPEVTQGFTRYKAFLYPRLYTARQTKELAGYQWVPYKEVRLKPFSSGHRKILECIRRQQLLPI